MRLVKIAIGNINPTVGAVRSNSDRVIAAATEMAAQGVTVGCFPEQVIGGYPPEDLVQWRAFVEQQRRQLERIAAETSSLPTVHVVGAVVAIGGLVYNVAAVVHGGEILGFVPKEKLPTYNVFYEARTFARGSRGLERDAGGVPLGDLLFRFDFGTLAAEVCEDAWSPDGPMRRRCYSGAELVVNVSSSPYRVGVLSTRNEMLATRSADNEATFVYANSVGGQDGLVYDGGGFVFQNGRLELDAPRFREGIATCIVDLDRTTRMRSENSTWRSDCEHFLEHRDRVREIHAIAPTADRSGLPYPAPPAASFFLPGGHRPRRSQRERVVDDLYESLALGVKDYYVKTGAFRSIGVSLSGGRDSMLTLMIAWRSVQMISGETGGDELRARVKDLLQAFYMPSRFSGAGTRNAAQVLCSELGVELREVPIDEAFSREAEITQEMLDGGEPTELTLQNIQARLRALRMWNWANTSGALFLQTGDMSEKAVGYTTIGGDLEGALSVIANVPKTVVIALLERLHERTGLEGIARCLETAPGPELAADQEAENELMPFAILDACLYLYGTEKLSPSEAAEALGSVFPDEDPERLEEWARDFASRFSRSIYKWVQAPLSLHVGSLDLDRERALQLPVVQDNEWSD